MSERKFAYGRDKVGGCKCPATTAGYNPSNGNSSTPVAEEYDSIVVKIISDKKAVPTVEEEKAKEAWLKAIEKMAQKYGKESFNYKTGVDVAEELGWM